MGSKSNGLWGINCITSSSHSHQYTIQLLSCSGTSFSICKGVWGRERGRGG